MGSLDTQTGCACDASPCQCAGSDRCSGSLPDNPNCTLNYHFGMLLGVEDLRSEQGFHLGQHRRHQRALHGFGVVHGLNVIFNASKAELQVTPGIAVDPAGRDLALASLQCVSLPAWWRKHRSDDDFADSANLDDITFDADVVAHYGTCLSRPVPAIADACANGSADIAYSRICEQVQLSLVHRRRDSARPVLASPADYHLALLFWGLAEPRRDENNQLLAADKWLLDALAALDGLAPAAADSARAQLWQAALARSAAASEGPISAERSLSDALTDDGIVLARLTNLRIFKDLSDPSAEVWQASIASIDIDQRATLVPTQLLQALQQPKPVATAGPQLLSASLSGLTVTAVFDKPLAAASLTPAVVAVHSFSAATGWANLSYSALSLDAANSSLSLQLDASASGDLLRLSVVGSGPTPLLGADFIPAGAPNYSGAGLDQHIRISGE